VSNKIGLPNNSRNQITAFSFKFSFQTQEVTNHGVLTRVNSEEASLSRMNVVFECPCKYVAGTLDVISPSIVFF
jgi:hypothetical protein